MHDIIWKLFRQTGNIETYLLLKELEDDSSSVDEGYSITEDPVEFKT